MLTVVLLFLDRKYFASIEFWQLWSGVALYHRPTSHPYVTPNVAAGISYIIQPHCGHLQSLLTFNNCAFLSNISRCRVSSCISHAGIYLCWLLKVSTEPSASCHHPGMLVASIFMGSIHSVVHSWSGNAEAISNWSNVGMIGQGGALCPRNLNCAMFSS